MGIMSRRRVDERKKSIQAGTIKAPEPKEPLPEKPKPTHLNKRKLEKFPASLIQRDAAMTLAERDEP